MSCAKSWTTRCANPRVRPGESNVPFTLQWRFAIKFRRPHRAHRTTSRDPAGLIAQPVVGQRDPSGCALSDTAQTPVVPSCHAPLSF